ncbi:hypothetical protein RGU70_11960 [Herbaspirillum sp. RTI4]|uniref:hypothetical protein n=1 Tax=Herbaspirillum sp. RTI4 TaxID=3048640 RepID=UPI002AB4B449|nr:hypothetical protein [Herbaspirillum sp. RTI4]MDY7579037.1 hypothetical protein [Herbaspirillum sp. RTI4]MEA9982378.1 hypothetical protein [Herbaspirillum sp. RTI4]
MEKSVLKSSEKSHAASVKPNLLIQSTHGGKDSPRILSALDGNAVRSKKSSLKRRALWRISGVVALVLVVGVLMLLASGGDPEHAEVRSESVPEIPAIAASSLTGGLSAPLSDTVAESDNHRHLSDIGQAAIIQNDIVTEQETSALTPESALKASLSEKEKVIRLPKHTSSMPDDIKKKSVSGTKKQPDGNSPKNVPQPSPKKTEISKKEAATSKPRTEKFPTGPAADSDVNILAALVSNSDSIFDLGKPKDVPISKQGPVNKSSEPSKLKSSQGSDDVTVRKQGESPAQLLQRCKQLSPMEAELCRWRICSGRWESDAVCQANE